MQAALLVFLQPVDGVAQRLRACAGGAPARHFAGHQPVEPHRIAGDQRPAGGDAQQQQDGDDQRFLPQAAHCCGPAVGEETDHPPQPRFAHAVEQEIAARRQPLEIVDQRRIEIGRAGKAERRQRRAIEAWHRQQFFVAEAADRPLLQPQHQRLEGVPVVLPLAAEGGGRIADALGQGHQIIP